MMNPLIAWEPGTLVRYHGSHPDLCDGVYRAHPYTRGHRGCCAGEGPGLA